jgi:hypothetical protein
MKRIICAAVLAMTVMLMGACGNVKTSEKETAAPVEKNVTDTAEENGSNDSEAEAAESDTESDVDDSLSELEAIGDVDVDKGLFNVTITVPKDFIGDTTQEDIDKSVKEKGYKSGTLNDDGSVTYVMNKEQHNELMKGIKESIDNSLAEMIGSENTPNITDVKANDDYTSFTVTTKSTELGLAESFSVMAFYTYGGMYAIFNGETVDNIHVDFVNADSGEVISSANSSDMGSGD